MSVALTSPEASAHRHRTDTQLATNRAGGERERERKRERETLLGNDVHSARPFEGALYTSIHI